MTGFNAGLPPVSAPAPLPGGNGAYLRLQLWRLAFLAAVLLLFWLSPPLRALQGVDIMPLWLHTLLETSSIVVAMLIFAVGWNAYSAERAGNILIIACALLAVGLIDMAHTLSYNGMPDFITPSGREKGINFWLAARLLAACAFLAAALRVWRPFADTRTRYRLLFSSLLFTALVYWLGLFHEQAWPDTFVEGQGLTPFKLALEYFIIALMLPAAGVFYLKARRREIREAPDLFAAIGVIILSELCFTLYSDVTDAMNLLGHVYKVLGDVFLYRAIFISSVREPFQRVQAEIVERQRAESAQRQSEQALRVSYEEISDLYNNAPCGYHSLDKDGFIVRVNDTELSWLGYRREELLGRHFASLLTPPSAEVFRKNYPEFMKNGYVHNLEYELICKDGTLMNILLSATAQYGAGGEYLASRSTLHDITRLKQSEAALHEREGILNAFMLSSPLGMMILDSGLRHVKVNQALAAMSGVPVELHLGKAVEEVVPKAAPMVLPLYRRVLESGESLRNIEFPGEVPRYPGAPRWWLMNIFPLFGAEGQVNALGSVLMDITERKQMEERLRGREATLAQAQQIGLMGSWEWNISDDKLSWSDELYAIYGLDPCRLQPSRELFFQLVPEEEHAALRQHMESALRGGAVLVEEEYSIKRPDGEQRLIQGRAQIFRDENGQPLRMVGVEQDVTERRQVELALRDAEKHLKALNEELERRVEQRTHQLEAANRELESFSYSVSHDLRAPLRSVDGFSQILLRDHAEKLDETGRDYLRRVARAAKRMGELIDDLLQLSRVGRSELKKETVDLSGMVCSVGREIQAINPQRQVEWVIQPGVRVEADSRLMHAMLENLLRNAWKFSAKQTAARIEFGTLQQDGQRVLFVRDNGAGFDMQYAAKLFAPFQRLHRAEEFEGTGVGLAIVQRIVNHHGGRIWAESAPGQGATFYFTV
jgi:PAS domain S-box-containing protein